MVIGLVVLPVSVSTSLSAAQASTNVVERVTSKMGGVVLVTHDRYLGHAEPDVAVNPLDPRNLIGACQFIVGARTRLPGTFASFDGGRSWHDNGPLRLPAGYEQGADTTVVFDGHRVGFVAALLAHGGGGFASRVTRGGIFLWKTTNGGRSFSKAEPVYVGSGFQDHPWLGVHGSTLYLAWTNRAGLEFTRSRTGGASFGAPRVLVAGSQPADPVLTVGGNGLVRVVFQEFALPKIRLNVVTSHDGGATFGRPTTITTVPGAPLVGGPKGGAEPQPLLGAVTDPATNMTAVAIAAQDSKAGHPVAELWQTTSHGAYWQGPIRPATGMAATMSQEQPRLVMAHGELYASFFTISRQGGISEQLARAPEGSGNFTPVQLAGKPFQSNAWLGDYQALAISGNTGYALWNDGGTGRLEIVANRFSLQP